MNAKLGRGSTRRGFLRLSMGSTAAGSLLAAETTSVDPIAELIRLEVKLVNWVREVQGKILEAPLHIPRDQWLYVDYGFRWPAFTLVHLFTTKHPDNPLHGAGWCAELAMKLIDKEAAFWRHKRDRGQPIDTGEVPHYVTAYVMEKLDNRVEGKRRSEWLEHEEAWVAQALVRPLGITAAYHDSWRMTGLYRLGVVLNRPKWRDMGLFLFKQLLVRQTKEGFWEDNRHNGPSARYCGLMLPSLAWMYRWTGDEAFARAARRLADFMATWAYPDSISVGPFDGRNTNVLAYFPIIPGLEMTARGRAYNARAFALWRQLDMLDDIRKSAQSTRDLPRLAFYAADTCEYLSRYAPKPTEVTAPEAPLPMDSDGVLENHTAEFDGLLFRKGRWIVALSSQNAEIPDNPNRLERQSRIEIWHQRARLTLGGGHNHPQEQIPQANVVLDTGYAGASAFGVSQPETGKKLSPYYYRPRDARSRVVQGVPELELVFGHGTVRYRFTVSSDWQVLIDSDWRLRGVHRLCLQLPLVLFRDAELWLDGHRQENRNYALREARHRIEVRGGPFAASLLVEPPANVPCRVHYPVLTGLGHAGFAEQRKDDPIHTPFDLALVSCQWTAPKGEGRAAFVLSLS